MSFTFLIKQKENTFLFVLSFLFSQFLGMQLVYADTISTASLKKGYSTAELDQMLAPIALYPDALLIQVLNSSTFPEEVVKASNWLKEYKINEKQSNTLKEPQWHFSIKSLMSFPDLLKQMSFRIGWTTKLGNAFAKQQEKVMDRIQFLRRKAKAAGNLKSNEWIYVGTINRDIVIEPFSSEMIYVPYYNPRMIYGSWWWSEYEPDFWFPWKNHGEFLEHDSKIFLWGVAVGFSYSRFYGYLDWEKRQIDWKRHSKLSIRRPFEK